MCSKAKTNTPLMYEVLDKDTLKSEFPPHLPWQNIVMYQKVGWCKSFNVFSTSQNTGSS